MAKFLLFSVLFAAVLLPMRAARQPDAAEALRRLVKWLVAFHVVYAVLIVYLFPRLL